ncbi:histone chaperone asf1b isoform X1 [Hydra vulgaris]|uniref:Histone chaperone asf1b isoform X1 n=1 Tax=Hydra vulgaris TaxID=6087 RepID=A0ABM4C7F3_HYDVU
MAARVRVTDVGVLNNPCKFFEPFQFQITFECLDISSDLEWKLVYVGAAENPEYDQVLDTVLVGDIQAGKHMFVFQADPPNPDLIPQSDICGVTVILLTCSYKGAEFIRVGYYVNTDYSDPELRENPPPTIIYEQLQRNILASQPRVTKFPIVWE